MLNKLNACSVLVYITVILFIYTKAFIIQNVFLNAQKDMNYIYCVYRVSVMNCCIRLFKLCIKLLLSIATTKYSSSLTKIHLIRNMKYLYLIFVLVQFFPFALKCCWHFEPGIKKIRTPMRQKVSLGIFSIVDCR